MTTKNEAIHVYTFLDIYACFQKGYMFECSVCAYTKIV